MQSKYVQERVTDKVVSLGKAPLPVEWLNYMSQWHKEYWNLVYKRGRYVTYLRELNEKQAARIMELEHDLRMARKHE